MLNNIVFEFINLSVENYNNGGHIDNASKEYRYYELKHIISEALKKAELLDQVTTNRVLLITEEKLKEITKWKVAYKENKQLKEENEYLLSLTGEDINKLLKTQTHLFDTHHCNCETI